MAKRRRLEAPSAAELEELETGFARETSVSSRPPIAQVAADAASLSMPLPATERASAARDSVDASRLRRAEAEGLLLLEIPLAEIRADDLTRDRLRVDGEEMDELRASIRAHGLRLPVEVFERPEGQGERFGLISGWRRLWALRSLHAETGEDRYAVVRALVRRPADVSAAYVSMVEENEIRADLSPYERGRIAALAAGQGAFASVEEAVDVLFSAASKAKRSKIRSFALIHEELGDLLAFAPALGERPGLRLAHALRGGYATALREVLATGQGTDAEAEWALMEPLVKAAEGKALDPSRGGRPARRPVPSIADVSIERADDGRGFLLRLQGPDVDDQLVQRIATEIRRMLETGKVSPAKPGMP
ncbi:ParB N-terminal domain-containing protein [Cereibacter sphaeroides]|uniref:ParB/RepB/Spo0J family partition protein n=1 Tax=Cereibacter sphaeroides TaxID=1063 RepID=UPI001F1D1F9A|nr:ParB N-terminal domain-containing protein [Cereibacter sphaeroides]MCE6959210.1 ParB N-terminal domain-containing protein [Cereibacter sphaeroides]MCE6968452.1 ParB N-terminal domain-containing protein [Cereibacter sphaeroides]MCE6974129.1 ParB N-terminal domain-containing protein [Cereibacter sphaeroides]